MKYDNSPFLFICILSCWISGFNVTYPLFCGSWRPAVNSKGLKSRNKSQTDTEPVAFGLLHRMRCVLLTVISNTCLPAGQSLPVKSMGLQITHCLNCAYDYTSVWLVHFSFNCISSHCCHWIYPSSDWENLMIPKRGISHPFSKQETDKMKDYELDKNVSFN